VTALLKIVAQWSLSKNRNDHCQHTIFFFQRERAQIVSEIEKEELKSTGQESSKKQEELICSEQECSESSRKPKKVNKRRNSVTRGKVGFKRLACLIATKWKQIDPSDLEYYKSIAAEEKVKYAHKVKLWKDQKLMHGKNIQDCCPKSEARSRTNKEVDSCITTIPSFSLTTKATTPTPFLLGKPNIADLARRLDDDCQNFLMLLLID